MKRTRTLILITVLVLTSFSCQPTPEQEFITPHGNDNILGVPESDATKAPAGATPVPIVPIDIPEHYTAQHEPQTNVFVNYDVDVAAARGSVFPQIEVGKFDTLSEPDFVLKALDFLGINGQWYLQWEPTKADYLTILEGFYSQYVWNGTEMVLDRWDEMDEDYELLAEEYAAAPE